MSADGLNIGLLERLLDANPRDGGAWSTLGVLLRRAGKNEAAIACHRRGLEYTPDHAGIWSNLGNVLLEVGRFDEAVAAHAEACRLGPDTPSSLFNALIALRKTGRFGETLVALERALALEPGNPNLLWERALTRLQIGDYENGFKDYEIRRQIPAYRNRPVPGTPWEGGPLRGRTLFLSTEQGFGDTLMAARYLPRLRDMLKDGGGRILMECHPELRRLLANQPVDEFVPAGSPFPAYDVQASLMSLPLLLGTTSPAAVPPPLPPAIPAAARDKAARLVGPAEPGTLRVGIVWSGRVTFADNSRRATSLARFLRLAEVPGVRLFSLQKGPPEEQLADLGTGRLVQPLGPQLEDFADTAAVLERLDLVIMTDSSVAHLAGSLGRPVWNLVQYVPYWIYGFENGLFGDSTPWYPSMRLFRQGHDQDWEPVFARVGEALAALIRTQARP